MRKHIAALSVRGYQFGMRLRALAIATLLLATAAIVAGAPADVQRGLTWLQAQVQPEGTLATSSQVAAASQAQCETAATLTQLAAGNAQVAALISALAPTGA